MSVLPLCFTLKLNQKLILTLTISIDIGHQFLAVILVSFFELGNGYSNATLMFLVFNVAVVVVVVDGFVSNWRWACRLVCMQRAFIIVDWKRQIFISICNKYATNL